MTTELTYLALTLILALVQVFLPAGARTQRLVGMDIPEDEQRRTLESLGFVLDGDMASVPSWRPDVQGEADLVEEIARIASLSRLEGQPLPRPRAGVPQPVLTPLQRREGAARRTAAALGYNECVTYSFIDEGAARLFGGGEAAVRIENPISSEMTHLRPDLLPGLLAAAARNQARGFMDLALFEVGPVFSGGEPGEQAVQLTPGLESPTVAPMADPDWVAVRAMVPRKDHQNLMDELSELGAKAILATDIRSCRF